MFKERLTGNFHCYRLLSHSHKSRHFFMTIFNYHNNNNKDCFIKRIISMNWITWNPSNLKAFSNRENRISRNRSFHFTIAIS
jgi:hypothetical protein